MIKQNPDKRQVEYWTKRNENMFLDGEKEGLKLAESLKRNYEQSIKRLTAELYIFYNEYANEGQLNLQDAKKLLSKEELKTFHKQLNEYIKYAKENQFNNKLVDIKLLKLKTRVSRLESLKAQIEFELSKLANETDNKLTDYLEQVYQDAYYKTVFHAEKDIGFKIDFTKLNTNLINKAVSRTYNVGSYSIGKNKVWENKDNLMILLNQSIPQGLTLGYNPKKLAHIIDNKMHTGYNATVRLMRTEYNLLLNDATADGYKACGIGQYQILATLDSRTSDICQEMDGEIFDLKDKEIGINYPPFHPNCRTTTIPYFEPDEIDAEFGMGARLAKDNNGRYYEVPANMTYKQWKEDNIKYQKVGRDSLNYKVQYNNANRYTETDLQKLNELYDTNNLTNTEINAIKNYTSTEHNIINTYLRLDKTPSDEVGYMIDNITTALDKNKLKEDTILYRGISLNSLSKFFDIPRADLIELNTADLKKTLLNKKGTDLGFASTYIIKKDKLLDDYPVICDILAPKNTNGLYINSISTFKDIEYEFLLQRDLQYKLYDLYKQDGKIYVSLKVI